MRLQHEGSTSASIRQTRSNLSHNTLDTVYLPTFDLLALPVLLAGSVMPRWWVPCAGAFATAAFLADFLVVEHPGGDLVRWLAFEGPVPLVARTIALLLIVTVVSFLWVTRLHRLLHDRLIAQIQASRELARRAEEEERRYMAEDFRHGIELASARLLRGAHAPEELRIVLTHPNNPHRASAQFVEHVMRRLGKALNDERRRATDAEQRARELAERVVRVAPPAMPGSIAGASAGVSGVSTAYAASSPPGMPVYTPSSPHLGQHSAPLPPAMTPPYAAAQPQQQAQDQRLLNARDLVDPGALPASAAWPDISALSAAPAAEGGDDELPSWLRNAQRR